MPKIIVKQAFKFAHHGYQVEAFEPGDEPVETTDECAELAIAEGWAVAPEEPPAPATKASESAPETRDAAPQRRTKTAS
jgi:hypothetical protein